ncbi:MAG: glycosyltransferase family 39 protein [Ignavibacteria bacterium]
MTTAQNKKIIFVSIVSVILGLKFFASYSTGLFEDEAIYWNWSQSIDASYSLTTIAFIRLFTSVFNSSEELIVRLPALLSNIFIILFIFKTGKLLNASNDKIYIAVITFLSIPFVTIYSSFISPDTFLLTFTLITLYYLLRSVKFENISDYVLAGVYTGSMILSKYTAVIFLAAAVISLIIISKKLSRNILVYLLTAITVSLPLIIWNLINEPVWFKYYMLTDADKVSAGFAETITTFIFSQGSILMPFGLLLIMILTLAIFKSRSSLSEIKFLKYLTILLMIIFVLFSLSGKIKGNWFFIIYLPVILFLLTM